jgi:hypothetical protein
LVLEETAVAIKGQLLPQVEILWRLLVRPQFEQRADPLEPDGLFGLVEKQEQLELAGLESNTCLAVTVAVAQPSRVITWLQAQTQTLSRTLDGARQASIHL